MCQCLQLLAQIWSLYKRLTHFAEYTIYFQLACLPWHLFYLCWMKKKLKRGLEVNQSWIIWELPFWPHFLKKNQIRKRTQQDREIKLSHRYGTNNSIMTLTLIALNITTCIKSYSILPMLKTVHSILSVGNFPYL